MSIAISNYEGNERAERKGQPEVYTDSGVPGRNGSYFRTKTGRDAWEALDGAYGPINEDEFPGLSKNIRNFE